MQTRLFDISEAPTGDGSVVVREGDVYIKEDGTEHTIRSWGSEKTALQWLRRFAQREEVSIEITKVDGSKIYMDYCVPCPAPVYVYGKHEWRKANTLALADASGPYDKLVCNLCGTIAKRYKRLRHFKEENQTCTKHIIEEL